MGWNRTTRGLAIIGLVALSLPAPSQEVLLSDTFSTRQGERPQSWTVFGAPTARFWFVENGQLFSGPGEDLGGDGNSYAVISVGGSESWTDCSIATQFWMRNRNGRVVLVGRWRDVRNHYEAYVQIFRDSRSAFIDLVRDGTRKTLAYGVGGVGLDIPSIESGAPERRHTLQLTMVGSLMGLYLDGARLIEASDTSFDRGSVGVGVQYNAVYFDNVMVEKARLIGPRATVVRSQGPQAVGTGQVYRFLMGTFDSEAEARRFQSELIGSGYLHISVEPAGQKWDVLVGAFLTEIEAQQERANLEAQGVVIPALVVRTGGATQYAPVARRRPFAPDRVFTLRMGQWTQRENADELKRKLELDGFFGSEARQEGTSFTVLYGRFRSREDAEKYRRLLESSNYKVLDISEERPTSAPGPALVTPTMVTQAIRQSEIWATLTAEQKQQFDRLMQTQTTAAAPDQTQLYMDLKKELDKLRVETRSKLSDLVSDMGQRETKQRQLAALFTRVNKAVFGGDFGEARRALDEIFVQDPENNIARWIQQHIELREKTLGQTIEQRLTEAQRQQLNRTLALAKQRAENFEREGYFQNALLEYESLVSLLKEHDLDPDAQNRYAEKIKALRDNIDTTSRGITGQFASLTTRFSGLSGQVRGIQEEQGILKSAFDKIMKYFPYALGAFAVLTVVTIWIFFSVRGVRRRNRLLLEQMQSLTLKPMMEIAGGGAAAGVLPSQKAPREIGVGAPPVLESMAAPTPPSELFPESPVAEQDFPFFGAEETPPSAGKPTAVEEREPVSTLRLTPESLETVPPIAGLSSGQEEVSPFLGSPFEALVSEKSERSQTAKMPAPTLSPFGMGGEEELGMDREDTSKPVTAGGLPQFAVEPEAIPLRLDDLLVEGEAKGPAVGPAPPVGGESTPLDLDMMGISVAAEEEEGPPPAAFGAGVFYEQSFDNEAIGTVPNNWKGAQESYEFASLKVAGDTPAPNSTRYLRFEKTEGIRSAYYSCQFPDATGQVAIEFDLRCDQKNKFLLGFYVEKDRDFRQCIHASIRQNEATGAAFLRIYGEEIPYEMGTWRHIKYVVNLTTGRLSGYVDGTIVLDNIRLTNCPRSLNTLSIRDNVPTTGVLLIDNIRISRV